jgi:hypothetical protein
MNRFWSIYIVFIILGSCNAIPADSIILEGSMVGQYQFEVSEVCEVEHPNIVNLTLTGGVVGVNRDSSYYNCGIAERLMMAKCRILEQQHEEICHLDRTMMYDADMMGYDPQFGRYYCFLDTFAITFSLTLQSGNSVVTFTIVTETDFADPVSNSSETISESASFNYIVQTEYSYVLSLDAFSTTQYLAMFGIAVIVILAMTKILPEDRLKT